MTIKLSFNTLLVSIFIIVLLICKSSLAATSITVWPVDPVIEADDNAQAIWLENNDKKEVYLQIRVLKWQQKDGKDEYSEQKEVLVSPPFAEVQPDKKQLIRLVKNRVVPENTEYAYRIFIDEVPRADDKQELDKNGSSAITFQVRYSVPLFVQGQNIWTNSNNKMIRDLNKATQPVLSYRIKNKEGKRWLVITNKGQVHARLSNMIFRQGKLQSSIGKGLAGYVLAGASMEFELPSQMNINGILEATVNENPSPTIISNN